MFDKFSERHIGVSNEKELKAMLETIGVKSVDELISQVIPHSIRLKKPLALPAEGMSEYEFAGHIRALAERNRCLRSFIGMGYYPCAVPAAVTRNVFENPAWYTSYTPYQAEISQGRLEALLNFQTAVISLTGMEIGNCSLLDEGTATAEAMLMMFALRSREAVREGRNQLFVDRNIFPQTLDVLLTRSEPFGIELIVDEYDEYSFTGKEFGAIVQYPAANGAVRDYADFTAAAHAKGALVTAVADLLALALLKAPGEWGADIAVGSTQRLGTPMGLGGPSAGYMTTREAFKRNMPGRIIGVSVDRLGNRALRMALQMREQHIKRERATSNICTASALMASMTGFYCVYNGPEGLKRAAEEYCANRTHYPYQVYINWPAQEEQGNILHNDKKFITLLYEMHEDYFADFSKVSDAGSAAKAGIYQFLEGSRRTAIVVDCENSDPYKLYAMLNNLDQNALLGKIAKIILYDDVHTTTAWQILEKFTQIPVEHVLIERVKENKSLVDIRLTTGTCCEFFQNNIDSFLLASSDSDYWGLIPAMPQARFFVLVEAEKCSGAIRKAMENGGIAYCYLDRFCTGNSNQIKETAMLQAVQRILDEEVQLNLHDVMNEAYLQTRAGMTTAERRQFCERYLQHLRIEIDETGNLRLVVGK